MKKVVSDFMKDKKVFCIHGEESEVLKMERLLKNKYEEKDCRNMFLMEYGGQVYIDEDAPKAFVCQMEDCERLMPLQTGFCVEEVLPPVGSFRGVPEAEAADCIPAQDRFSRPEEHGGGLAFRLRH